MKALTRLAGLAIVATFIIASGQVFADEVHSRGSANGAIPANSLSPAALGRDPLMQPSQSDDLSSRVDELEASRATVEQKSKSPVSLSISGWVGEQVTYSRQ